MSDKCPDCGKPLTHGACSECGWYPGEPKVTLGEIGQIAFDIQKKAASPDDARQLLVAFCERVEAGISPPTHIMNYLCVGFRGYMRDEGDLERVLSLKPRKGHPPTTDKRPRVKMAIAVLECRLLDETFEEAIEEVAEHLRCGVTAVKNAWGAHKRDALDSLRVRRFLWGEPWTTEELRRLDKIYRDMEGYVTPGKSVD
jgi:hypothetical protein